MNFSVIFWIDPGCLRESFGFGILKEKSSNCLEDIFLAYIFLGYIFLEYIFLEYIFLRI